MTTRRPITHVIFDMDGVLLATEPHYTRASLEVCRRYGLDFTMAHKAAMLGRRALESAQWLVDELQLPMTAEEFLVEREPLLDELFLTAEPMPGAEALTSYLVANAIPHAVASSSSRRTFDLKTQRHLDWFARFTTHVLGDDPEVHVGKPAPDIFLVAARRMGAAPEACLVFEDAPAGIEAARAAGMHVVSVPDPAIPVDYPPVDEALGSLDEFRPETWGLPPR